MPIPFAAIGIDHASAALNLPVRAGSLAGLDAHTIAVDTSWHERLGATMSLWRPDGTPVSLRVVAILAPSLSGVSLVVDSGNAGDAMPSVVYVRLRGDRAACGCRAAGRRPVQAGGWCPRPGGPPPSPISRTRRTRSAWSCCSASRSPTARSASRARP